MGFDTIEINLVTKSNGPSREPWGTPTSMFKKDDFMPSTTTHCFLFER